MSQHKDPNIAKGGDTVDDNFHQKKAYPSLSTLSRTGAWIELLFIALAAAAAMLLFLISLFSTSYFKPLAPGVKTIIASDMVIWQGIPTPLFFISCIILIVVVMLAASIWLRLLPSNNVGTFVLIYSLIICVTWVLALNTTGSRYAFPDSTSLIESSRSLLLGNFSAFNPHGEGHPAFYTYYSWYPFQTGALLWFSLVFGIFGINNLHAFLIVNAVMVAITMWSIVKLSQYLNLNSKGQRIVAIMVMLNIPLITSSGYVYSNSAGLCLALIAVLIGVKSFAQKNVSGIIILMSCSFLLLALSMLVKGTEILFALAMTLIFILLGLRKRVYWISVLAIVLFVIAHSLSSISVPLVESITGQRFGPSLPQLSWIAIGLSEQSHQTAPGWWTNSAINIYSITQGDQELQNQFAKNTIIAAISSFLSNPGYAFHFFTQKLASEWAEPTYQGLYFSSFSDRQSNSNIFEFLMYGSSSRRIIALQNIYQSVVYCFAACGFLSAIRIKGRQSNQFEVLSLYATIFLAGFGCFIFWEAKSVYTLPFATILLLPAGYALQNLAEFSSKIVSSIALKANLNH